MACEIGSEVVGMKCAPTLLLVFWLALLPALAASGQKDFERGTRAFGAQKYQEAAHYFQKAIKAEPQNALFYLWLGITQYRLGDYSASQAALQKAVELEPYGQAGMAARRNLEQLKAVVQQRGERGPQPGASGGQGSAGGRPG
ncbi:MAG TPA: tetratricopeptide repeat protein, partial [Candidatus Nitrosotenuis sp.]|nr:tetratricopeptide repeat protein [Candidatus Nitrosotenuis sp.]